MRTILLICFTLVLFPCDPFAAPNTPVTFQSLLKKTVNLETLYLPPQSNARMFSSYDRDKGNRDDQGFIRKEENWYVIAEMTGPGAITRIWTSNPIGSIQIFIDKKNTPLLEQPIKNLFSSKTPPFQKPFVYGNSQAETPHWSYIPIPYKKYCKIRISEPTFYQIEYAAFPNGTNIQSFQYPATKEEEDALKEIGSKFIPSTKPPFKLSKTLTETKFSEQVPAGEIIQLASITGPAILRGFRLYWGRGNADLGRDLLLKIYWDNSTIPNVYAPVHDFFGSRIKTMALGVERNSVRYCYFPMPFTKTARIELENENLKRSYSVRGSLYLQKEVSLPSKLRTFHAFWQRDNEMNIPPVSYPSTISAIPCDPNENFEALTVQGSGHLVGFITYRTPSPQSDTMIFVDGSTWPPTFPGCGNEGFFDMAGKIHSLDWPLAGGIQNFMSQNCALRLLIPQPISFEKGLSITLEHGPSNTLHKDYSTTTYWYQNGKEQTQRWMLPPGARHFRSDSLIQPVYSVEDGVATPSFPFYESDSLEIEAIGGHYEPQDMLPFGTDWSQNQQILFKGFDAGGQVQFQLPPLLYSGWYTFDGVLTRMPAGGMVNIEVNGKLIMSNISLTGTEFSTKQVQSKESIFLDASDQPEITFILQNNPYQNKEFDVGVDTLGLIPSTETAKTISVIGPLGLPGDPDRLQARWIQSKDNSKLLLGYDSEETGKRNPVELKANSQNQFDLGHLVSDSKMNEALCLLQWSINVKKPGIYRLEISPETITPFLLQSEGDKIKALSHKILVNGIILRSSEIQRFSPEEGILLPSRYHVPLRQGENKISWLLRCNNQTKVEAKIYGTQPE